MQHFTLYHDESIFSSNEVKMGKTIQTIIYVLWFILNSNWQQEETILTIVYEPSVNILSKIIYSAASRYNYCGCDYIAIYSTTSRYSKQATMLEKWIITALHVQSVPIA